MKERCRNPNCRAYPNYGGRGIYVCERWMTKLIGFDYFMQDMGPRPPGTSIERIDNNGPYTPKNCRWATKQEQQRNQTVTRKVSIAGKTYVAVELAEQAGLKTDTVISRAKNCATLEEILSKSRKVYKPGLALGGIANGARQRAKTHCPHGHEYTPDNLVASKNGSRKCKACHRQKAAEARLFSSLL